MTQIRYRLLLPAVQLTVYIVLIWFGCPYRQTWVSWFGSSDAMGIEFSWIDGPPSSLEQLAFGINFPVVAVLMPAVGLVEGNFVGSQRELLGHLAVAFAIPFFWFLIGRWIDGKRVPGVSRRVMILNWIGLVLLAIIGILVILLLLLAPVEFSFLRILMLVWIATGIWVLGTRTRTSMRSRALNR